MVLTALPIENLESMSAAEEKKFWINLEITLANDDGAAAKEHLVAGRPITYRDPYSPNDLVRKWPDGRRELIDVDDNGNVTILKCI